ncbi:MAG TPA: SAM-dependent methyltransferase [Actinospica sp.]|nr:SAM-dependent methyltransferase [Actinospica sp.]
MERPLDPSSFLPWSAAMDRALYGPEGFFRRATGPGAHFRTSVHASPLFATAVLRLLREVDAVLGHPDRLGLVDIGAGHAELLTGVLGQLGDDPLARRLWPVAVELAERPPGLPDAVEWLPRPPKGVSGLIIANEWLDNVPCDVVEFGPHGPRLVEVAPDGTERLAGEPNDSQQAWLEHWWPTWRSGPVGDRAEIGLLRDAAWARTVESLDEGVAVAVDYAHAVDGRPPYGSLTGYAEGRQVPPVPDGRCDLTAHVALDACAAAAEHVADWSRTLDQRTALRRLGITGARPDLATAASDPIGYVRALSRASAAAELTDPAGLGGFQWLVQGVAVPIVPSLED